MKIRTKEQRPSQLTSEILWRESEDDPEVEPTSASEPVAKPLVAFEPLPRETKAVAPRW
jgi:hypothetical protein